MPVEPAIRFSGVSYNYPEGPLPALREVNLGFDEGDFVLVMGPSGSGKSTLLRCLNGLVPHFYGGSFSGTVSVFGRDPIALGPRGMSDIVGFVFQDPETQFIVDGVADELAFAMEARAYPRPLMEERIREVSALMGVEHLLERRVSALSGGQRQRVAVAAALALRPPVLVLDEPTSQLDPVAADELLLALVELNRSRGLTVFLSEHRLERVVQYVHRVVYVPGQGEAIISGTPREILPEVPLAPPVVRLGRYCGWQPAPLTVEEAQPFVRALSLPEDRDNGNRRRRPDMGPHPLAHAFKNGERDGVGPSEAAGPGLFSLSPRILARDVHFSYGSLQALRGASLELYPGEILAIQGHNGAGKTTLLKSLVGLLHPQEGRILLDGTDMNALSTYEIIRKVGYVPQSPGSLLFQETVRQELEFTRHSHGLPPKDPLPLLERLGLERYAGTYPRDLSQGERQRVALAAILVAEPEILLLDEPTLGLDYLQKSRLVEVLRGLRDEGKAILMATHDVELVAACADRTVVLGQGQVLDAGEPGQVMLRQEHYASQISRLFADGVHLTLEDVLGA